MRRVGLGLALVASVQFVLGATPAFAQDPASAKPADTSAAPAPATAPAAPTAPATPTAPAVPTAPPAADATKTETTEAPKKEEAPKAEAKAEPALAPGMVTVHLNTTRDVALERRDNSSSAWQHVCNSPCDTATSSQGEYRVLGTDLNESKPFILDASKGDKITLDVSPGIHNRVTTGGVIVGAGAAFIIAGAITIGAGSKFTTAPGNDGTVTDNKNFNYVSVGSVLILAGVIAGLGGGAMIVDNMHTKVEGPVGAAPDRSESPGPVNAHVEVKAERGPTWHEDRGPALGASTFVPMFRGTF